MWSKSDSDPEAERPKPGAELVPLAMNNNNNMVPAGTFSRTAPMVGTITDSSVHVGHRVYKITHKLENTEKVTRSELDRLLADADSDADADTFDNWEEVEEHLRTERDKSYPLPRYIWNLAKNSTRAERLSCAASIMALLLCSAFVVYFSVVPKSSYAADRPPHPWNITREMWRARPPPNNATVERVPPIKLVIIQNTGSPECFGFTLCAAQLRNLQSYFMDGPDHGMDVPYNFVIGNDGRVYRVRDWDREGDHIAGFGACAVGIAFIGDYREDINAVRTKVTDLQLQRLKMILQEGVDRGYLSPDYSLMGARDVASTKSPGEKLYRALQTLDHFENTTRYKGLSCEEVQQMSK